MDVVDQQRNLERFGQLVLADRKLHEQLRASADEQTFVTLVVQLGAARGCDFTAAVVVAALRERRRAWLERWI